MASDLIHAAQQELCKKLNKIPGVIGVGIGENAAGAPAIHVHVTEGSAEDYVPSTFAGFDVLVHHKATAAQKG